MESLLKRYPSLESCRKDIEKALALMIDTYKNQELQAELLAALL